MKRFLVVALVVIGVIVVGAQAQASFPGGDGSPGSPYQISTCQQLQEVGSFLDSDFVLIGDIECTTDTHSGGALWNDGLGFSPIGSNSPGLEFRGVFDGNGYRIDGLFINRPAWDYVGLFGMSGEAEISDVGLTNVDITGRDFTGGLVGYTWSTMSSIFVTGDVSGRNMVGGIAGELDNVSLTNSYYAHGTVTGGFRVGGLVGFGEDTVNITNSHNSGAVSGIKRVGGLIGSGASSVSITDSYNTGTVTAVRDSGETSTSEQSVGGLLGASYYSYVVRSFNSGTVTASGVLYAGGLIGSSFWNGDITQSYNSGNIIGDSLVHTAGGLIGSALEPYIDDAFNSGSVTGQQRIGGLIGSAPRTIIATSYNSGSVTGLYADNTAYAGGAGTGGLLGVSSLNGLSGPFDYDHRTSITDSFDAGTFSAVASVGGIVGSIKIPDWNDTRVATASFANNFFYAPALSGIVCNAQVSYTGCTEKDNTDYFKGTFAVAPFTYDDTQYWEGSVWNFPANQYPQLKNVAVAVVDPTYTVIPPAPSSSPTPAGAVPLGPWLNSGSGFTVVSTPIPSVVATPIPSLGYRFTKFLARGSRGEEVRQLQLKLKALGFFPVEIDSTGFFGPTTEKAVKAFQKANGIPQLGIVGPLTRAALNR